MEQEERERLIKEMDEMRARVYPIPTLRLALQQDYRNLKAGLEVEFRHRFVAVVGDNGSGKSSLLQLLKSNWEGHYQGRLTRYGDKNPLRVEGLDAFTTKMDYCTESDSVHGKSFGDMDYLLQNGGLGISAMRLSSGQAQNMQLGVLVKKLLEAAPDTHAPALVVLDEPEASLSLKMRMTLAATLSRLAQRFSVMLLVATHDESVIGAADAVYDIESGGWHLIGTDYIAALRDATTKQIEKVYGKQ